MKRPRAIPMEPEDSGVGSRGQGSAARAYGRFALYLLSPYHCSVSSSLTHPVAAVYHDQPSVGTASVGTASVGRSGIRDQELAGSEIRGRVLRRRGFSGVLVVNVCRWEQMASAAERDEAIRRAVMRCLTSKG